MIRGIERRNILKDSNDRDNIIERLAVLLPETQTVCYAWVLMANHAQFLFPPALLAYQRRRAYPGGE
jgi:putative transposase